jgi:hypothetical protein
LDKINEILLSIGGILVACFGWVIKRLFRSVDKAHARITTLEKSLVDRPFLESQLAPIRQDLNLILSHLLEHRQTEKEKTHPKS